MRGYVHPEWVPRHLAIRYWLLGHLFKVHIPVWFVPGVFATLKRPGYRAETPSASFLPSGWCEQACESLCKFNHFFIINVITQITLFCYAGQVIC